MIYQLNVYGCRCQGVWDVVADGAQGSGSIVFDLSTKEEDLKSSICPLRKSLVCPTLFLCYVMVTSTAMLCVHFG